MTACSRPQPGIWGVTGSPGGITFVAASGDTGAWSGVSYPAASPNVLSVGATTLNLGAGGSYLGESGWTDSTGGFSALEPAPAYQIAAQVASRLSYGLRTLPDVAAVGDPSTGLSIYDSFSYGGHSGWFTVGGTSASAPQWAGLIAVADQGLALAGRGSLANAQSALYSIPSSAFHEVTSGFNGYSASSGYNLVSGLGTPIASQVVAGLVGTQVASPLTGLTSSVLTHTASSSSAHAIFVLATDNGQGTNNGTGSTSGSSGSAPAAPVVVSNPVVIIVPVGSSRVVVILPPVTEPARPLASSSHLVEPAAFTSIELASPAFSPYSKFGQGGIVDSLTWLRSMRAAPDREVTALIDLVEPFQPPVPVAVPRAAASLPVPRPTFFRSSRAVPFLPRFDREDSPDGPTQARAVEAAPFASPLLRDARDDELREAGGASRLAAAAALAGAGWWLTLRESDRNRHAWSRRRTDVALEANAQTLLPSSPMMSSRSLARCRCLAERACSTGHLAGSEWKAIQAIKDGRRRENLGRRHRRP